MDANLVVSSLQGLLVWLFTAGARKFAPDGSAAAVWLRRFTPEISIVLAVAIVAAWQSFQGNGDVLTLETLKQALTAAGGAVLSHSLVREKIKALRGSGGSGDGSNNKRGAKLPLLVILAAFVFGGCAPTLDASKLIPAVQLERAEDGGCLEITIVQPVPVPEGWSAETTLEVRQDCAPATPPRAD